MDSRLRLAVALAKLDTSALLAGEVARKAGDAESGDAVRLVGWVVGRQAPVARVELWRDGTLLQAVAVGTDRTGIAPRYPEAPWAGKSGFQMLVKPADLASAAPAELRAVFPDGTSGTLASLWVHDEPLPHVDASFLQPLLVTSVARSGSTWLMQVLAEHPGIVAYRRYPYEMRPSLYWLHMFEVLSGVPDRARPIDHPKSFRRDDFIVGANPFHTEVLQEYPSLGEWSEQTYRDNLARFSQESIEQWYRHVAANQDQPDAVYFAEKRHPNAHTSALWDMYPGAREVILVRDFRDAATSALAFNERRGHQGFGRGRVDTDEEFLRTFWRAARALHRHWQRRKATHMVRYEDLITAPDETLGALLEYLGLDADPATMAMMRERATGESASLRLHKTSGSTQSSLGRWRSDLDPALQPVADEMFHDLLVAFGYDPSA